MLNKIIHYSLHNRLVVVCAAILLLIAGTYTAMHTEVDVFPDLNAPTVVIMTEVLLVMAALSVVWSIFLPSASFFSIPNNSIKAPRVPLPSSREITTILLPAAALSAFFSDSLLPQPVKIIVLIAANKIPAAFLFIFITIASKIFMIYF
mgnify:CR=1 FL=1